MTPAAAEQEQEALSPDELRDAWPALSAEERAEGLKLLPRDTAEDEHCRVQSRAVGHGQIRRDLRRSVGAREGDGREAHRSSTALFRGADILTMHNARIDMGRAVMGSRAGPRSTFFDPSVRRLETFDG